MPIIPYNTRIIQAEIPPSTHESQTNYNFPMFFGKSRVQTAAYELYDMGLNVVPQPRGAKGGYPWKRLQFGRLNRDDKNFGLTTLFAGDCNIAVMCGATSGNLFIIDCETTTALKFHMSQLQQRNIPLWVVETARGGHIYLRAAEGEVTNVEPSIMKDVEIRGQRGYVLAPPSIHPTGAIYTWLVREGATMPVVSIKQVDWLRDTQGGRVLLSAHGVVPSFFNEKNEKQKAVGAVKDETILLSAHGVVSSFFNEKNEKQKGNWTLRVISPCSNLANATRDYIQHGHTIPEGSRNNRLFAAACDMCGNGYSLSEAGSILTPPASGSGLAMAEINSTIKSAYSQNRNPSRPEVKLVSDNMTWHYAVLWATNHIWHGATSGANRALCLALIERCRLAANEHGTFRASIRELAELSRLGTVTVQRGLERLQLYGIIQRAGFDSTSGASLWQFTEGVINGGKQEELKLNTVKYSPHWLRFSVSLFNSDITERGALGHSVMFVYQYLNTVEMPMMPKAVAAALQISIHQVNYAMRKMRDFGLLQRLKEGWEIIRMSSDVFEQHMAQVAADVIGKGVRRAARFVRERQLYAGRLLHDKRLYIEGAAFYEAIMRDFRRQQLLEDPLIMLGLELGGVIQLDDGTSLALNR
jgi:hypothetical protein